MTKLSASVKVDRIEFEGISASPGFASGRIWIYPDLPLAVYRATGDLGLEAKRLKSAIALALHEVMALLKDAQGQAVNIVAFQIDVLKDETFYLAAVEQLMGVESAFEAWRNVLEIEIAGYQNSHDTVFQSKAFDLQDIQARVARILCQQAAVVIPKGAIVVGQNLSPSAFIAHDWLGGGIALTKGSITSHLAILARQFGVPMVTNLKPSILVEEDGKAAVLKIGNQTGKLIVSPTPSDFENKTHGAKISEPPKFEHPIKDTKNPVEVMINLSQLRELHSLNAQDFDGIGLVRTEFLLAGQNQNPLLADEDTQFHAYCEILKWANGTPVFIRTIDAGGDKSVLMKNIEADLSNRRGLKLSLSLPHLFGVQIRALLRAAAFGPLHVTLPMVESQNDFEKAFDLFKVEANQLSLKKIAHLMPSIGMMVEVPSVALSLRKFVKATHFALGTNDLIQLALGQSREAALIRPSINNQVILNLIKQTVAAGVEMKKTVHVCGDAASNVDDIPHLLAAGVTRFSISPPSFSQVAGILGKKEKNRKA